MTGRAMLCAGMLILPAMPAAGAGAPAETKTAGAPASGPIDAKAALERLKMLAGTWEGSVPSPEGETTRSIFAVTAGGSAVMETMFPGTKEEMVTVFFLDGATLRATHYCSAGNQPRLRFDAKGSGPNDLRFAFDGGSNFDPKKDMHIHSARFILGADGALTEEWEYRNEGKTSGTHRATLTRR
jgi:hypothetical protein